MTRTTVLLPILALAIGLAAMVAGCGGKPVLTNMTSQELFEHGKLKYDEKDYLDAIEYFQAVVYNFPGESIVDTAQYYLALSYFGTEEYELAQVEFNRLLLNYPASVYFQHAVFMKAVSFFQGTPKHYGLDQSDLRQAIKQFEDFIIDYPESELLDKARDYLLVARTRMARKYYSSGVVYSRIGAYDAATRYFQKVVDDYTDTEFAPLATFKKAVMQQKLRNYEESSRQFEGFFSVFAEHKLAAEARERGAEVSFKSAEQALKKGEYATAKQRLESFIATYPQHDKVKKAREMLRAVESMPLTNAQGDDAGS
ncbi:MAG: outer membrane protein assembly factor BamD [Candidatus Zixiibacteriota bacterium]|nr:MAG: outer membrane protein assembly factor BamD [candidate division Zixibacteria bacterium]